MSTISSIGSGISPLSLKLPSLGESSKSTSDGSDFGSVLKQAVGALGQLGAKADASSLALAKGDPVDIHEVMLNTEQASLGLSMALQGRTQLIDHDPEV